MAEFIRANKQAILTFRHFNAPSVQTVSPKGRTTTFYLDIYFAPIGCSCNSQHELQFWLASGYKSSKYQWHQDFLLHIQILVIYFSVSVLGHLTPFRSASKPAVFPCIFSPLMTYFVEKIYVGPLWRLFEPSQLLPLSFVGQDWWILHRHQCRSWRKSQKTDRKW